MNDGGSAYPTMFSLRDWFAGLAMQSLLTNSAAIPTETVEKAAAFAGVPADKYNGLEHYPIVVAKATYGFADAMLAEREKIVDEDDLDI